MDSCFPIDPQSSPSERYCAYSTISTAPPKKRAGRTKFRETRHPFFKGVRGRGSNGDRWVCEVRDPNNKSRIWLGTFPSAEMAARAHDVAAMALRGRKACLNFADSAWRLVVPDSASHKDIQKAAAAAAEMFRPSAESKSGNAGQEQMFRPSASSVSDVSDHEQSLSPESLESSETEAEKILPTAVPFAVEMGSLLEAVEFRGDYFWESLLTEPSVFSHGYCTDDPAVDDVADVPLWSYFIRDENGHEHVQYYI